MKLHENIKKYRRARDITQEDLAEMLGISAQAVSHWECGRTAPDVTQLPILANLFEVTTDTLLGVDVSSKGKRIEEIRARAHAVSREEALVIFREAVQEYPDSHILLCDYAWELYRNNTRDEIVRHTGEQIAAYLDRILRDCTDSHVRNRAVDLACHVYPMIGRRDDALALAQSMENAVPKRDLLPLIYEGQEKIEAERDAIVCDLTCRLGEIPYFVRQNDAYSAEEKLAMLEKVIAAYRLFFEDGDYFFEAQAVEYAYQSAAWLYVTRGETEKAVLYAVESAKCAVQFDTYEAGTAHTSLLLRGKKAEGIWWDDSHNRSYALLAYYRDAEDFAACRDDKRFCEMLEMLEKTAK